MYPYHSVQAYLRRKSNEELKNMLNTIFTTGTEMDNADGIFEILKVFDERNVDISTVIIPELKPAYQNFLEYINSQKKI